MNHDTPNETLLLILNYFLWYSVPKPVKGGKNWYVLNSNNFGQEHGIKRTTFAKYRDELLERCIIVEVQIVRKRGTYYSVTPLGLSYLINNYTEGLSLSAQQIEKCMNIINQFVEKYSEFNGIFFDKSSRKIENIYQKLKDSKINLRNLIVSFKCFKTDDKKMIDFSIPIIYHMLDCTLVRLFPQGKDEKIKILEYDPDLTKKYEFDRLKVFDFHHYCAMLLVSSLIYYSCKKTLDSNYIKTERDLVHACAKNSNTKEWKSRKIVIKPDLTILKSIDDELYLILIKFANHIESILKQATSFNYSFIENIRKK